MSVKAVAKTRPATIESVTLTMTGEHACALRTLLRQVAGHPDDTDRKLFDEIEESLAGARVGDRAAHEVFRTCDVWLGQGTKGSFK